MQSGIPHHENSDSLDQDQIAPRQEQCGCLHSYDVVARFAEACLKTP